MIDSVDRQALATRGPEMFHWFKRVIFTCTQALYRW